MSADVLQYRSAQDFSAYTDEDHAVWREVVGHRLEQLVGSGSRVWLDGFERLGMSTERLPDLRDVNTRLAPLTGWSSVAVPGYIPAREFFAFLAEREFPTTTTVRPREKMAYLPEPDIIHDVFGHVPLHADPAFAEFLQVYGASAKDVDAPDEVERLARLFWFTVEFGLIREDGQLKLYGSGLVSSEGEGRYALTSPDVDRRPFDLEAVLATPFEIDHYQPILYVLESFTQLRDAMRAYASRLRGRAPAAA